MGPRAAKIIKFSKPASLLAVPRSGPEIGEVRY